MKYVLLVFMLITSDLSANNAREQVFGPFTGDFQVNGISFEYRTVTFSGYEWASGEVVFELHHSEEMGDEIFKVSFIPDKPEMFPSIKSGYYAKELKKVDLLNHDKARTLLFTDVEWTEILKQRSRFVSKKANIEIMKYATSIECDSRQYYAEIRAIKPNQELAQIAVERKELSGC